MERDPLRFCVQVPQDASYPELRDRWRRCEELGFDAVYVADHMGDPRDLGGHWLDGWTTLAVLAEATSTIRVGVLVSSPILHDPAVLARAAVSIDHLSGGRLELGLGTGVAGSDHAAAGVPYWGMRERVERFAEFVEVVDRWLRTRGEPVHVAGRHYRSEGAPLVPAPVQQPRPPIIVAGQSPTVLTTAAAHADVWNTHGPFGADLDEILAVTRQQNRTVDELCASIGRDPATLRRSVLLLDASLGANAGLDAWATPGAFEKLVTRFIDAGANEIVIFWPQADQLDRFEHAARKVLAQMRSG